MYIIELFWQYLNPSLVFLFSMLQPIVPTSFKVLKNVDSGATGKCYWIEDNKTQQLMVLKQVSIIYTAEPPLCVQLVHMLAMSL